MMETFLNSFFLVFISEIGDKTQLLALMLTLKFRTPWTILAGIFVATILNHALASWFGGVVAQFVPALYLKWILASLFFGFALWILIPDKEDEVKQKNGMGPFLTTVILFFLAEMGDKTQLATVALGAKYASTTLVTLGTTVGMMASNAMVIFFGDRILVKIPLKWVRIFACISFMLFAVAIVIGY